MRGLLLWLFLTWCGYRRVWVHAGDGEEPYPIGMQFRGKRTGRLCEITDGPDKDGNYHSRAISHPRTVYYGDTTSIDLSYRSWQHKDTLKAIAAGKDVLSVWTQ